MSKDDLEFLGRDGVVALAWASLAGGYLAGREIASWRSDQNERRRRRAKELADRIGTTASVVAVAYVLHQPQHVLAAAGTRSEEHLMELISATTLELSTEEIEWLESG